MPQKQKVLHEFYTNANKLADLIESEESNLLALLTQYETYEAAHDEIERSTEALRGAEKEFSSIEKPLQDLSISTFFPLNLPLYSLVLFGVMPSAFARSVFIRPPEVMNKVLKNLWKILNISEQFPALSLNESPRHIFTSLYASESDAIIFTGKYKNALDIHQKCPDSLLLYNGSGVNPFLILPGADLDLAVKKSVEMRCFNSGQDCAGPDAFFVHESQVDNYIDLLKNELENTKVGSTTDPTVNVGPTVKVAYIAELVDWIQAKKVPIIWGGEIDTKNHFVHPAIAVSKFSELDDIEFHEFFAPFFYIISYAHGSELERLSQNDPFRERSMYLSVFGEDDQILEHFDTVKILQNTIVNDVERGNDEYGGYGEKANFLLYGDQKVTGPVLVSRDLHRMLPT